MPDQPTETVCCGAQKPTNVGKPHVAACILCPESPTYWRDEPGAKARLAAGADAALTE
jgi:hypothetical protein